MVHSAVARAALCILGTHFPESVAVAELDRRATQLARKHAPQSVLAAANTEPALERTLLDLFEGGVLELLCAPAGCLSTPSAPVAAFTYARLAAQLGRPVPNLHHRQVTLDGPTTQLLLLLDGTKSLTELTQLLSRDGLTAAQVEESLGRLARAALLTAGPR